VSIRLKDQGFAYLAIEAIDFPLAGYQRTCLIEDLDLQDSPTADGRIIHQASQQLECLRVDGGPEDLTGLVFGEEECGQAAAFGQIPQGLDRPRAQATTLSCGQVDAKTQTRPREGVEQERGENHSGNASEDGEQA
jgi:hypothetical protein